MSIERTLTSPPRLTVVAHSWSSTVKRSGVPSPFRNPNCRVMRSTTLPVRWSRGRGYQRRDGCPNARHPLDPNYVKVWTQEFGQTLSMACCADFVLFKPL